MKMTKFPDVKYPTKLQYSLYLLYQKLHKLIFGVPVGVHLGGYLGGYIKFGKNVRTGHNVQIITRNHKLNNPDYPDKRKEVVIDDNCWIGSNAVILPGIHLGTHTIVAAGAVVTKSFPEGHCIIAGVPARKIKENLGNI